MVGDGKNGVIFGFRRSFYIENGRNGAKADFHADSCYLDNKISFTGKVMN